MRGGASSQLNSSSQSKQNPGNASAVSNASAGLYHSAQKNPRSNSKAYNPADDQIHSMAGTFKAVSKTQPLASGKLNRRAGSGHVDVSPVTGEYTKLSTKSGQVAASQHVIPQPAHDSFPTGTLGQVAPTGVPTAPGGAPQQHSAFPDQPSQQQFASYEPNSLL